MTETPMENGLIDEEDTVHLGTFVEHPPRGFIGPTTFPINHPSYWDKRTIAMNITYQIPLHPTPINQLPQCLLDCLPLNKHRECIDSMSIKTISFAEPDTRHPIDQEAYGYDKNWSLAFNYNFRLISQWDTAMQMVAKESPHCMLVVDCCICFTQQLRFKADKAYPLYPFPVDGVEINNEWDGFFVCGNSTKSSWHAICGECMETKVSTPVSGKTCNLDCPCCRGVTTQWYWFYRRGPLCIQQLTIKWFQMFYARLLNVVKHQELQDAIDQAYYAGGDASMYQHRYTDERERYNALKLQHTALEDAHHRLGFELQNMRIKFQYYKSKNIELEKELKLKTVRCIKGHCQKETKVPAILQRQTRSQSNNNNNNNKK